jgi:hypothetical protein
MPMRRPRPSTFSIARHFEQVTDNQADACSAAGYGRYRRTFRSFSRCVQSTCSVRVVGYPRDAELTHPALEQHVLDNLPSSEPITLIGESSSSPIALHLSNNPKLNIRAAVLVCSFASHPRGTLGAVLARLPIGVLLRLAPH